MSRLAIITISTRIRWKYIDLIECMFNSRYCETGSPLDFMDSPPFPVIQVYWLYSSLIKLINDFSVDTGSSKLPIEGDRVNINVNIDVNLKKCIESTWMRWGWISSCILSFSSGSITCIIFANLYTLRGKKKISNTMRRGVIMSVSPAIHEDILAIIRWIRFNVVGFNLLAMRVNYVAS